MTWGDVAGALVLALNVGFFLFIIVFTWRDDQIRHLTAEDRERWFSQWTR